MQQSLVIFLEYHSGKLNHSSSPGYYREICALFYKNPFVEVHA